MKNVFLTLVLIIFILVPIITSAQSVNVPLDHWLYDFLDRMETKGLLHGVSTKSYPFTRFDVAKLLAKIELHKNQISPTELALFDQLKGEFHEELSHLKISGTTGYKERHLFTWRENEHSAKFDVDFNQTFDTKHGDQYESSERTSKTTIGGILRGRLGKYLNFYVHAQNTLNRGTDLIDESFDPSTGMPVVISGDNVYNDDAWAYITWDKSWFYLEFGRDQIKWGPGKRGSLMLSAENPLFEFMKLKFTFNKFQFTSFFGSLHSGFGVKYFVGHRLDLMIRPWLFISGSETVVYGNRNVEASYLIPIIPYHVAEHHLGDKDNNAMAFDVTAYPFQNHKFYFELMLDDYTSSENPLTYYGNKFAFQVGHRWINPFSVEDMDITWEYARIEPFVYTHIDSNLIYQNYNQCIGHWLGPNSDALYFGCDYLFNRDLRINLSAERIRHGKGDITESHEKYRDEPKKFLSGTVETKWNFGFEIINQIYREDIFLSLNYYYSKTSNLNKTEGINSTDHLASISLMINW